MKCSGLTALQAEAAVMAAHGHALKRDTPACFAALSEAERDTERFSSGSGTGWLTYIDGAHLSAKFGHVFRDLGYSADAERFARRSLAMNEGDDRGKPFNTALLASTLVDHGHVTEGPRCGLLSPG